MQSNDNIYVCDVIQDRGTPGVFFIALSVASSQVLFKGLPRAE